MTTKRGKKISGGRYRKRRKRKAYEAVAKPRVVLLGEEKKKKIRITGGKIKIILLRTNRVNVMDPKTHKAKSVQIKNVIDVPSNKFLARKNILMKGAVIDTEAGKAKITNRPGQEGCVQAVLLSD
ncbi:MAG: 30S ribosomal protein S8e [Candidatus Pacearchaeota archaeon]|nr:MAG: 30S ribosomal protein S8e [Candidatus Pacearchaeota archaeon]